MDEDISFGAVESFNDSRTLSSDNIARAVYVPNQGKVALDYPSVNELCNQKKVGICTMCGVRIAAEEHFEDGIRLDEYWGYLMGKVLYDDPKFGHFEGSSALTMLKTATNYGIPEKEFCKKYPLITNGTYNDFIQSFENYGSIPKEILENAKKHKIEGYFRINPDEILSSTPSSQGIAGEINAGRVVIARFALGNNLHTDKNGVYTRKAEDLLPLRAPDSITGGHIMAINEYWRGGMDLGGPNSWSRTWCPDNDKQEAGYYWFVYKTQKTFFTEAWAILDKKDKYMFTKNLTVGSTGPDVVALQKYLVKNKHMVMPVGVSYGFFGNITKVGVAKYQAINKITPAVGYFGPLTRKHLNANQ